MKKRFVVLIDSSTKEQNDAFLNFIRQSGVFGWWHWLNGSWLLVSSSPLNTSQQIRDKITEIYPGVNNIVLEFREDGTSTWNGFGPQSEERNMFKWMHENW